MSYKISFFKNLANSQGHPFKCLQHVITLDSSNSDDALTVAQRKFEQRRRINDWRLHADTAEVTEVSISD